MKNLLTGALAVGTLAIGCLGQISPAEALSFNNGTATINTATDLNQSFIVNFDGSVSQTNVAGLSSTAQFTFKGIDASNRATFDILLSNTSSGAITSRTSGLGFNIDPNATGGTVSGLFDNLVFNGSLPNGFGSIELCATDGKTCQGGENGGVFTGESGLFTLNLQLSGSPVNNLLVLNNFGVRYQSITGTTLGTSGTGIGTPSPIPTPALLPGLIGMGIAALRKKKSEEELKSVVPQGVEA